MSVWDYIMPHRLLINKSLRKEAEGLRTRIDDYQIEYDRKIEECQEELKQVETEHQEKLVQFKDSLVDELQKEIAILESVAQDITTYADTFLQRDCLYKIRGIKKKQNEIYQEDCNFLTAQMALIGNEIDTLQERQDELTSFTSVVDIIQLTELSDCEIDFSEGDSAKDLLDKVSKAISNCGSDQDVERYALVRLKGIIQERSEYLPTIKYIAWVIQQKIQFSRQLSEKRKVVKEAQTDILQEIEGVEKNIRSTTETLEELAKRIRYYWAHPITYLSADISYAYKEKAETGDRLRDVGEELHRMASWHSDDQDKWERLQSERSDLASEMDSLKDSISSDKNERNEWFERKNYVFQLCKKYGVPLIPEKKTQTDEDLIITERLTELAHIRTEGTAEAERICEQERADLLEKYQHKRSELEYEISGLEDKVKEFAAERNRKATEISATEKNVKQIKDKDDRFFLVKVFSETPGLEQARKVVNILKKELSVIEKTRAQSEKKIIETRKQISELDKQHEKDLRRCRPRVLRPTAAEDREEKKLLFRQAEIKKRREEGGHEN